MSLIYRQDLQMIASNNYSSKNNHNALPLTIYVHIIFGWQKIYKVLYMKNDNDMAVISPEVVLIILFEL